MQSVPFTTKNYEFESRSWQDVLDTTLCDKVCQLFAAKRWLSTGTLVSSINKIDCHDKTEILLKVALNTITLTLTYTTADILPDHILLSFPFYMFRLLYVSCWRKNLVHGRS